MIDTDADAQGYWAWRKSSFSQGTNNTSCVEVGHWRKSSFSQPNGNECVEVAHGPEVVGVRDSKNTDGPILTFASPPWAALLDQLTS